MSVSTSLYQADLALWYRRQAALLRERRFDELDLENLIDELDVGAKNLRRELSSRLRKLLICLLSCQFLPEIRTGKLLSAMIEQRSEIEMLLEESPSLAEDVMHLAEKAYPNAVHGAVIATDLPPETFPISLQYSRMQLSEAGFVP